MKLNQNIVPSSGAQCCSGKLGLLKKANSSSPTCLEDASEHGQSANVCSISFHTTGEPSQENSEPGKGALSSSFRSRTWSAGRNKQMLPLQPTGIHEYTNKKGTKKSRKTSKGDLYQTNAQSSQSRIDKSARRSGNLKTTIRLV